MKQILTILLMVFSFNCMAGDTIPNPITQFESEDVFIVTLHHVPRVMSKFDIIEVNSYAPWCTLDHHGRRGCYQKGRTTLYFLPAELDSIFILPIFKEK